MTQRVEKELHFSSGNLALRIVLAAAESFVFPIKNLQMIKEFPGKQRPIHK